MPRIANPASLGASPPVLAWTAFTYWAPKKLLAVPSPDDYYWWW